MDTETRKYLTNIADIVNNLQWAKLKAEIWCEDEGVDDPNIIANCMVMAMLWGAALRDYPITQSEVLTHLGVDDEDVPIREEPEEPFFLHPDLQELSFDELMCSVLYDGEG